MSRIEEAIKQAVKLRTESAQPQGAPQPVPAQARPQAAAREEAAYKDAVKINCVSPYIVALNDPTSPIAEEYRKLKSMIVALTSKEEFLNTIMVTSTVGAEGKSITSLNLAISLAKDYDYTVLLIDADIRKPSLHNYLNLECDKGITDCLMGEADLADAIIKTDLGKLSFLPAGKRVADHVELLSSQKMKDLIQETKSRYPDRYIIIDTPPILPFAETRALSYMVDGVLFVVKERTASVDDIGEALGFLEGSNMLGIVYNGVSLDSTSAHYRYYNY